MHQVLVSLLLLGLSTALAMSSEDSTEWTWLDRVLREEVDKLAFRAAEFEVAEDRIAAADLYREAIRSLTEHEKNGWRYHSYRERYRGLDSNREGVGRNFPGAVFDEQRWDGFDPALLLETVIPRLEFREKPLRECFEWLTEKFNAINSKQQTLEISLVDSEISGERDLEEEVVTLRLINAPVWEGFRYTSALVQMRVQLGDKNLIIKPLTPHSRDLLTLVLEIDQRIAEGRFGTGKQICNELGITLRHGESLVFKEEYGLIVRMRDENLVRIALWLKMLDRIQDSQEGFGECRDRLRMAEHYASIGEKELHDCRLRQARGAMRWLKRFHPGAPQEEFDLISREISEREYLVQP